MIHKRTIRIPSGDVRMIQEFIDEGGDDQNDSITDKFSASFDDGIEADIRIIDSDPAYIDAVLFQDGHQVDVIPPTDKLVDNYIFRIGEDQYIVTVRSGTEIECPNCGKEAGWYARIQNRGDCMIDSDGNWVRDMQVDDTEIYAPYQCQECGTVYNELPKNNVEIKNV